MDEGDAVGEVAREDAEARADLEHDVVGPRARARRPMTPRMFSSTRKCWPSSFFGEALTRGRTRASAFASICASSSCASSPRAAPAPRACGRRTPARSAGRGSCGARYGASVSARSRSAGPATRRRGGPTRSCTSRCRRTRRTSRARARPEQRGRGEAVEDDVAVVPRERGDGVVVGCARVDHAGLPSSRASSSCASNTSCCRARGA